MKTKTFIAAIIAFTFFNACNQSADKKKETTLNEEMVDLKATVTDQTDKKEKQQIPVGKFSPPVTDPAGSPVQTTPVSSPDWDSKIIKTANLKLEIKDFKKYNDFVHNAVKQYGAYVAQEDQNLTDEKSETTITIKVPVPQFENMMNKLPDDGKVIEKKISSEDVTGEVVDTKSRLEAKKQMRLKWSQECK